MSEEHECYMDQEARLDSQSHPPPSGASKACGHDQISTMATDEDRGETRRIAIRSPTPWSSKVGRSQDGHRRVFINDANGEVVATIKLSELKKLDVIPVCDSGLLVNAPKLLDLVERGTALFREFCNPDGRPAYPPNADGCSKQRPCSGE